MVSQTDIAPRVVVYGAIPAVDQTTDSFYFIPQNGIKVKAPLTLQYFDTVIEACKLYKDGLRVRIHAIGKFNRGNKLEEIETVERIEVLDPLDITARVDELKLLSTGWFDGEGQALSTTGLDWLVECFGKSYPDDLPLPYLYPTPDGGVLVEWSFKPHEASLEIDLATKQGEWHSLNLDNDLEDSASFKLENPNQWQQFVDKLRQLAGATV